MFTAALAWAKLYSHLIAAVAIAGAIVVGVWWIDGNGYSRGAKAVQAKWDAEKIEIGRQSLKLSEQALRDTATLQANADKLKGAKNAQIASINAELSDALERLRNRPSRDSAEGVSGDTTAGGVARGCTGAGLYKEDGAVLIRLARDADELRVNLKTCYQQYNAARDALAAPQPTPGK